MAQSLTCSCGYSGPSMAEGDRMVCPICRTPATAARSAPPPVPPAGGAAARPRPPAVPRRPQDDGVPLTARETFRIPCPNGHVNVSPAHLLGKQVVCPKCNAFYTLELKNSHEYRRHAEQEAQIQDEMTAKKWLSWAIYAAIFIALSIVGMIAWTMVYES